MIKRDLEEKFNSAIDLGVVALGGAIVSGILLLTPAKVVGYIGMGSSVGGFVASVITKKKVIPCGVEIVAQKVAAINRLNEKLNQSSLEYQALEAKKGKVLELANQALQLQDELAQLRTEVSSKSDEIATLQSQLKKTIVDNNINLEGIKETVLEAIGERQRGLHGALEGFTKKKDYQLSDESVRKFKTDIDEIIQRYFKAIQEVTSVESACEILHWGIDELANVKVRMIRSYQSLRIQDLLEQIEDLEKANQEWDEANLVPREALEKVRKDCVSRLKEFHLFAKSQVDELNAGIAKHEELIPLDDEFFKDLRSQIKNLEQKLAEESKPHRFVGASEQARVGNALIDYYLRSGLILDAIDWQGTELGYKLMFHFGRNGVYISPDQLHENDARQQIKAMTSSLSLPEFKQSERGGHIYLEVQQRLPQKKQSPVEEVKRLLMPIEKSVAKIVDGLSHKPTVRIMGATGEGKGVMTRYLLNTCLLSNSWYTRLHDPQHGSEQDYWGIPKVSKSGSELKNALAEIDAQMRQREADKNWSIVTLDVLDEIDTHLDRKEKKESFIDLISRIRHLGMKLILIGQNPKVGRAGFEWSDMQQMNCIYMGASAYDAIIANPQLQPKKDKLTKEYTQLSEHYEIANEGLDDGEKHLFGLIVIPGKTPFWVELPRPDSIEITCHPKLLGKVFQVPVSLNEFVESQNTAKSTGNSGKTNKNSTPSASAENLVNQGMAPMAGTPDYVGVAGTNGRSGTSGTPTCKQHPAPSCDSIKMDASTVLLAKRD